MCAVKGDTEFGRPLTDVAGGIASLDMETIIEKGDIVSAYFLLSDKAAYEAQCPLDKEPDWNVIAQRKAIEAAQKGDVGLAINRKCISVLFECARKEYGDDFWYYSSDKRVMPKSQKELDLLIDEVWEKPLLPSPKKIWRGDRKKALRK